MKLRARGDAAAGVGISCLHVCLNSWLIEQMPSWHQLLKFSIAHFIFFPFQLQLGGHEGAAIFAAGRADCGRALDVL